MSTCCIEPPRWQWSKEAAAIQQLLCVRHTTTQAALPSHCFTSRVPAFLSTRSRLSALPLFLMFSSCLWLFILTNPRVFLTSALVYDTLRALFCVLPPPLVFFPHYYKCHICTVFYLMWAVLLCSSPMNHLIETRPTLSLSCIPGLSLCRMTFVSFYRIFIGWSKRLCVCLCKQHWVRSWRIPAWRFRTWEKRKSA